jgi:hypothetical protein
MSGSTVKPRFYPAATERILGANATVPFTLQQMSIVDTVLTGSHV